MFVGNKSSYWNRVAEQFARIYDYNSLIDLLFRKGVKLRAEKTLLLVRPGDRVLDLGCGPGLQVIEAAKRGASLAVGVDYSEKMLDMAKKLAKEAGVSDKTEFHLANIYEYEDNRKYDIVWALGVFDYQKEPVALLKRMKRFSNALVVASFRRIWVLRYPIRKVTYFLRGQYVTFHTKWEIESMFKKAGINRVLVERLTRSDYLAVGNVND